MTTLTVLRKMRKLLTPKGAFTKYALARDDQGGVCEPLSKAAVCYCIRGVFMRAGNTGFDDSELSRDVLSALKFDPNYEWGDAISWNNHPRRSGRQVLSRIDAAIRRVQKADKRKESR